MSGAGAEIGGRPLKVAVAQPLVALGDCAENIRRMAPLVESAAAHGAGVILFSECAISGYDYDGVALDLAIPIDDPILDEIEQMANRHGIAIVAGLYERAGDRIYNSALAFLPGICAPNTDDPSSPCWMPEPGAQRILQRKHNVIEGELATGRVTPAPRDRVFFTAGGLTCAILICADGGTPGIFEELAASGCELVLHAAAGLGREEWAFRQADLADSERLKAYLTASESVAFPAEAVRRCCELNMAYASANQCGWDPARRYFHPGHSMVVDRNGKLAALIPGRMVCEHVETGLAVGLVHGQCPPGLRPPAGKSAGY